MPPSQRFASAGPPNCETIADDGSHTTARRPSSAPRQGTAAACESEARTTIKQRYCVGSRYSPRSTGRDCGEQRGLAGADRPHHQHQPRPATTAKHDRLRQRSHQPRVRALTAAVRDKLQLSPPSIGRWLSGGRQRRQSGEHGGTGV
jgi:hypothetical protein